MDHNYKVNYKNVILRPLAQKDIEALRVWRNKPENTRYLRNVGYISKEMQRKWFSSYIDDSDILTFAIEDENKKLVGSLSLYHFRNNEAEFGKLFVGESIAHGKKVGLNAVVAAINIAFYQLNVCKLYLHVYRDNAAAVHIYTQAGFTIIEKYTDSTGKEEYVMVLYKNQMDDIGK